MSYGTNIVNQYRRAADYTDKILRGAKPGELPVEQPTKFDLVINLTTVKVLGLTIPPMLLARAEVCFAAPHESAIGRHATSSNVREMSAIGGKADSMCLPRAFPPVTQQRRFVPVRHQPQGGRGHRPRNPPTPLAVADGKVSMSRLTGKRLAGARYLQNRRAPALF